MVRALSLSSSSVALCCFTFRRRPSAAAERPSDCRRALIQPVEGVELASSSAAERRRGSFRSNCEALNRLRGKDIFSLWFDGRLYDTGYNLLKSTNIQAIP